MKKLFALLAALALLACAATAFAVELTDQTGRVVTIEAVPQRIVSGYYISTSTCIALGLEERLVAIEAKADTRNIYALAAPALMELPQVGTAKAFDMEACLAVEPDLVILPKRLADAAETLADFGIPALLVDPEDAARMTGMIELIGEAAGGSERAGEIVGTLKGYEALVAKAMEGVAPVTALMLGNSDRMTCAPGDMYQSAILAQAGAVNAAEALTGGSFAAVSYEQLLAWDPQALIIPPEAAYGAEDVLADPELASLTAVQSGAVYAMPTAFEAWDSPAPSGELGALWLAQALHPEAFSRETYVEAAVSFYETFYGFTPDVDAL